MSSLTFKIIFVVGIVFVIIRIPYQRENRNNTIILKRYLLPRVKTSY